MRFVIYWASLIVGSKFTVFALFYFVFEGNFPSTNPRGAYIWRGDLIERFFALTVWGVYIWRGSYLVGLIFGILRYIITVIDEPSVSSTKFLVTSVSKEVRLSY